MIQVREMEVMIKREDTRRCRGWNCDILHVACITVGVIPTVVVIKFSVKPF